MRKWLFVLVALVIGAIGASGQTGVNQVSVASYNPSKNALNAIASGLRGSGATPSNADQVFTSIFNPASDAIQINLVGGLNATGLTFGSTTNSLLTTGAPTGTGQCLISGGSAPFTLAFGSCSAGGTTTINVNGSAASVQNPINFINGAATNGLTLTFANLPATGNIQLGLSGTLNDTGLSSSYSGVGACAANQFATTLARAASPTCTAAIAALTAPAHEFFNAVTAAGAFSAVQPAFGDLSGTASDTQLASAYSGVGACAAHEWASTLTRNAAPTCTQPAYSDISGTPALYYQTVDANGTAETQRPALNLIPGANMTVSCADNAGSSRTDCTFSASASSGMTNPMTALGDIIYENSTPAPARLAGNTTSTKEFLTQTGTGSASAAPAWGTIAAGDVPAGTACAANQFATGINAGLAPSCAAALTALTAPAHQFFNVVTAAGVFSAVQPAFTDISGSVAASQLPNPSATTLGGIESAAAVSHEWINSISTAGVPSLSQPAFADISGTASAAQIPNPAGDVTGTYAATTVTGLHFGSTGLLLGVAPASGQCLGFNGTNITGTACSGGGGASAFASLTWTSGGNTAFNGATVVNGILNTTHAQSSTLLATNLVNGQTYKLEITQDSTGGGVTLALGTSGSSCTHWKVSGGGSGALSLSTSANAIDLLTFTYDGANCLATLQPNFN